MAEYDILSSNDLASRNTADPFSVTATTTAQTVTFNNETGWVEVENNGRVAVYVNLDEGNTDTWWKVRPGLTRSFKPLAVSTIQYKTLSSTAAAVIIGGIAGS